MLRPFLIILGAVGLTVTGELLLKSGMNQVGFLSLRPDLFISTLVRAFSNPKIVGGFALVFGASLLWLSVLSRVPLSWAYPMLSMSYVLGVAGSAIFLGEHVSWTRVLGVMVVISGVVIVYRS
jgi:drug/metabolite transporter (DMT)-like permease